LNEVAFSARLARVESAVLAALERDRERTADPAVLLFLLRAYSVAERTDLGQRLESALGTAVQDYAASTATVERARWLTLFVEVCGVTEDARVRDAVAHLTRLLSRDWPDDDVDAAAISIDACLSAGAMAGPDSIVAAAIDELERLVGRLYKPGRSLGALSTHLTVASALLTAFALTARIPYAMLAEELVQVARRDWWDGKQGVFAGSFEVNCDAARTLHRLAMLHGDADYVSAAVIAEEADYDLDAARILSSLEPQLPLLDGAPCARFGLALIERQTTGFR
jgi:hypothetical protein